MAAIPARAITAVIAPLLAVGTALMATAQPAGAGTWAVPKTSAATVTSGASLRLVEDALMVEINQARRAHGLAKIRYYDTCIDKMAESWGERIARTGIFAHRDQMEVVRKCDQSWAGENLIRGTLLTPQSMVKAWLDSPGHRAILLSPKAKRAGVAVTRDPQGRMIGVLNVGRPLR